VTRRKKEAANRKLETAQMDDRRTWETERDAETERRKERREEEKRRDRRERGERKKRKGAQIGLGQGRVQVAQHGRRLS
jgi:hypothetical protein